MGSKATEFDIIVIGAGIMGSSTAYHTAKRGLRTLLLEQFDLLHQLGSSHGESRTIRTTYPEDYYADIVFEASKLWREAESEAGYRVYTSTPHLDMGPANDASLRSLIASCRKNSISFRILDHRDVANRFSGRLSIPEDWIAVSTELGGVIKPTKAVSMFQALAFRRGAVLKDNMEVKDIKRDEVRGGMVVYTSRGDEFWGRKCVVTAGAWTKKLVHSVTGHELPIQPLETAVYYWRIKEGHEEKYAIGGGFPTFASYGQPYLYGTPSLEFPGLVKIAVHGGIPCDPDKRPWTAGTGMASLKEWIEGRFLGLLDCSTPATTQSCMYSMTPDEDFVLDFLGGEFGKDVVIGGGFSGHGFKMSPAIGRILADLVLTGRADGVELKHFRIGRFDENPKGNIKEFADQVGFN
ncbi:Epidermal patterning factor-like protein [Psidium guajava]|nr:Epidermal patterning factor-like protein [Psidium guajava]